MKPKNISAKTLILIAFALLIGLIFGSLATRWHYKKLYKDSINCGSVSYYDKTGKTKVFSGSSCER